MLDPWTHRRWLDPALFLTGNVRPRLSSTTPSQSAALSGGPHPIPHTHAISRFQPLTRHHTIPPVPRHNGVGTASRGLLWHRFPTQPRTPRLLCLPCGGHVRADPLGAQLARRAGSSQTAVLPWPRPRLCAIRSRKFHIPQQLHAPHSTHARPAPVRGPASPCLLPPTPRSWSRPHAMTPSRQRRGALVSMCPVVLRVGQIPALLCRRRPISRRVALPSS